ncbi:hypothetical protein [Streptacidiphilus sp. EB103A]|uniref:hypothetical protein n=1 Tax=Streptacidiphilus sp. EB103A TaxID=3156275 RepID=UPI003514DF44
MSAERSSDIARSVVPRLLRALVSMTAFGVALLGAPANAPRTAGALGGTYLAAAVAALLGSLAALGFGRWCGVPAKRLFWGLGPAWRTTVGPKYVVVVRRVPLPILQVGVGVDQRPGLRLRRIVWILLQAVAGALVAGLLLLCPRPFGTAAGLATIGFTVIAAGVQAVTVLPGSSADRTRTAAADAPAARAVMTLVVQAQVHQARAALDDWTVSGSAEESARQQAEVLLLMAEGQYRQAAALAEVLVESADLHSTVRAALPHTQARALAYALESEGPDPLASERFFALYLQLRDTSVYEMAGSDLRALYFLAKGDVDQAVHEARTAARVGSAPLRRCMTLCTLALALNRAQRHDAAHKALARARKLAPEVTRVGFVERVLELGRGATHQETVTS